jgi:hypothetical protein
MNILVMLEEGADRSPVLAHVNSVPAPLASSRPPRDVVTLYGVPSAESLALALAAAVESHRTWEGGSSTIRHLRIWPDRGAVGDAAWRDERTGELRTQDIAISSDVLHGAAGQLLEECGAVIRQLVATLVMPDWPEGTRRAISFSLTPVDELAGAARPDAWLDRFREADGSVFDGDGD